MGYWGECMSDFGRRAPEAWSCSCGHSNKRYMNQCSGCGERRPREKSGQRRHGIMNLASHKEADGRI